MGEFGAHQQNSDIIDEIARAALALSKKKIGALMAIERETGLKSYIETGTEIDSNITSHILISIFIPQSPLHDGAVVIRHGRIVAAGCVLPLTQEERGLPKSLGMRHRAAIGISEETDAVSVVVSEETGAISVASGGKLMHGLDEASLIKILKGIFFNPTKRTAFRIASRFSSKAQRARI